MVYENVDESNKADIEASFKLQLTDLQNRLIEAIDKSGTTRLVPDSQVEKAEIKTTSSNNEEKKAVSAEVNSEKVEAEALKDTERSFCKKGAIIILNKNQLISAKREYRSRRVYILFLSFKEDYQSDHWNDSIDHFLNRCDHQVSQEQVFLVVDKDMIPDITDIEAVPSGIRICLYLNGKYVNTNIVNEHTNCMVKGPTRLGSFVNEGCEKDLKEWKCNICNGDVKYGFDENFYCECGYESMFEFSFKCNSLMHGCEYIPFEEDRLEIQIMNMEAPKQNKVRSAIIQGQSAQKLRKIGHTLPDSGYLVIAHINIDNYTKETLTCLGAELRCGEIPFWSCSRSYYKYYSSPGSLEPGVRFKFSINNSESWYGFADYCGKIDKNTKYNKLFDKSEYKIYSDESSEWIQIENDDIEIRGKMGIESDCEINIQIIPRNYTDFAPQLKN
uniref:DUF7656 domain-containing protein n=1 Tax=Acrobeloides nanus TaxID=290746 RepID=A0A914C0D1_9BILA